MTPADFNPSNLAFAKVIAQALDWCYSDSTGQAAADYLRSELPLADVRGLPRGQILPTGFIFKQDGKTVIGVSGTTTGSQLVNQVTGFSLPPVTVHGITTTGYYHQAVDALMATVHQVFPGTIMEVLLCGHSYGGAVVEVLAAMLKADGHEWPVSYMTFGAPRAGWQNLVDALVTAEGRRYVNELDPITMLPPKFTEAPSAVLAAGGVVAALWNQYQHPHGGRLLYPDGSIEPGEAAASSCRIEAQNLATWIVGGGGVLLAEHLLPTYLARLRQHNMPLAGVSPVLRGINPSFALGGSGMPFYTINIFYKTGSIGWSTVWYTVDPTINAAFTRAVSLRDALRQITASDVSFGEIRVSDNLINGDSAVTYGPNVNGQFPGTSLPAWNAINIRLNSGALYRRPFYLRGIPTIGVTNPTPGVYFPTTAYANAIALFGSQIQLSSTDTIGWRIRAQEKPPGNTIERVSAVDVVPGGYNVTFATALPAVGLTPIAKGDMLQFTNTRKYSKLRGRYLVNADVAGLVVPISATNPTSTPLPTPLYARRVTTSFFRMTVLNFVGFTTRHVGRPFDTPRGRRKRPLLVTA
jgi:pimeloyl-ACP methyl ester carboxylesterase